MAGQEIVGPLTLFLLMIVVGLELTPEDFRRVLAASRAVVGGTLAQLLLLPLMTWAVVVFLEVPPIFGAGAVLVAAAPGAGISNILAAISGANLALSVTLTGVASVLAVVTLPLMASLGMRLFLGDSIEVDVPVAPLMAQLGLSLLLPIGIGMGIRLRRPEFAARHARRIQRVALVTIAVLLTLGFAFADENEVRFGDVTRGLVAAGAWTLAAMAIGFGVGWILRLSPEDRFTLVIEFSARNIAVAAIVALSGLGRLDLTLFSGAYMVVGYPLVVTAVLLRRRRLGRAVA